MIQHIHERLKENKHLLELTKRLLKTPDRSNRTPIYLVARYGHKEICEKLFDLEVQLKKQGIFI